MSPSPWAKTPARTRAKPISSEMETQSIIWPRWKQVKVTVEKKYGVSVLGLGIPYAQWSRQLLSRRIRALPRKRTPKDTAELWGIHPSTHRLSPSDSLAAMSPRDTEDFLRWFLPCIIN